MDFEAYLAAMDAAVADADAELTTVLGGHRESVQARLWRGQVLVDWEPDESAGGCLLRPGLVRRLVALHATTTLGRSDVTLEAPGRSVAALSQEHAELVARLGGARRVALRARLRFADGAYVGGDETYAVVDQGRSIALLQLIAQVRPRTTPVSTQTSRGPT
jgi:hypothetical protein